MYDQLVQTGTMYAAIYDEGSPVNIPGFFDNEFAACIQHVHEKGLEDFHCLFEFNRRLRNRALRGELLPWTFMEDGIFLARITIERPVGAGETSAPSLESLGLGGSPIAADLVCPIGRLIVSCLGKCGEINHCAVNLEPGTYRIEFCVDPDEEPKHAGLSQLSSYPPGAGPDWKLTVRKADAGL